MLWVYMTTSNETVWDEYMKNFTTWFATHPSALAPFGHRWRVHVLACGPAEADQRRGGRRRMLPNLTSVSLCPYRIKADGSFGYQDTPCAPLYPPPLPPRPRVLPGGLQTRP